MRRFALQALIVMIAIAIVSGAVMRGYVTSPRQCARAHPCCPERQVPPCCALQPGEPHGNQPGLAPTKLEYSETAGVPASAPGCQVEYPAELAVAFGRTVDSAGLYLRCHVLLI